MRSITSLSALIFCMTTTRCPLSVVSYSYQVAIHAIVDSTLPASLYHPVYIFTLTYTCVFARSRWVVAERLLDCLHYLLSCAQCRVVVCACSWFVYHRTHFFTV